MTHPGQSGSVFPVSEAMVEAVMPFLNAVANAAELGRLLERDVQDDARAAIEAALQAGRVSITEDATALLVKEGKRLAIGTDGNGLRFGTLDWLPVESHRKGE